MIQVARFVPFYSRACGGSVIHVMELTKYLQKYPVATKIYAASELDYEAKNRAVLYQKINSKHIIKRFNSYIRFRNYRVSFGLFSTLLKDSNNIDIFHSHAPRSFQEDIAALVAVIKKKKLVITSHGVLSVSTSYFQHLYERLKDLTSGFVKNKLLNIDYIAVTKLEALFFKKFGFPEENIHIIPHGIDTSHFKPSDPSKFLKKYNLSGKKIILFVGRISKGKRIDLLVEAFAQLQEEIPEAILLIAGGDFGYKVVIEQLIKKQNLNDKIIFLGHIEKNKLPELYSLANVVVMPAKSETFGHVALEANACEKIPIASNHWGPKEIIENGKTGYLIEYGNIEEMKEKIKHVIENENRQVQMGKYAREYVKKNYSWESCAQKHYELYKKLLE